MGSDLKMQPELTRILGDAPAITKLASGYQAACGPIFSRIGYLLFCDRSAGKILKWEDGSVSLFRESSRGARGLTFDHQGRLLVCERDAVTRTEKDGRRTVLAQAAEPCDVVYAVDGQIYFADTKGIHQIQCGTRKVVLASSECERPAGLALSPDQQSLYATDAARGDVRLFRISADGTLGRGSVFVKLEGAAPGPLRTDENGYVWVATSQGLEVFGRDAKPLGRAGFAEPLTGVTWGAGFRDVIVTSATSLYRLRAKTNGTRTY